jgi:hypothetical protein
MALAQAPGVVAGEPPGTSSRSGFALRTRTGRRTGPGRSPSPESLSAAAQFRSGGAGRQRQQRQRQPGAQQPGAEPGPSEGMPESGTPAQPDPLERARQAARTQADGMFARSRGRLSSGQFRADAKDALATGLQLHDRLNAVRHGGFGAALRYGLGLPPVDRYAASMYRANALRRPVDRHPGYWAP